VRTSIKFKRPDDEEESPKARTFNAEKQHLVVRFLSGLAWVGLSFFAPLVLDGFARNRAPA
jgi:hypothetical protein